MTVRALAVTDRFSAGVAQCKDPDKVPTFPDGACIAVLLRVFPLAPLPRHPNMLCPPAAHPPLVSNQDYSFVSERNDPPDQDHLVIETFNLATLPTRRPAM